jgi:uncharacterized glyoxalase superfamily protein PhnB
MENPVLNQLNLIVSDFPRACDFYRRIGVAIAQPLVNASGNPFHATGADDRGVGFEFDSVEFAKIWNPGWAASAGLSGRIVLGFSCPSRADVDRIFGDLVRAGYSALAQPHDAFWGSRYAIVEDPNGIAVGLMSPVDLPRRTAPPKGWGG